MNKNIDQEFTLEIFYNDIKENFEKLESSIKDISDGNTLHFNLYENDQINARVSKLINAKQYLITFHTGLAKSIFNESQLLANNHASEFPILRDLSVNLITRALAGCSAEMVFWHEYAHIFRGHLNFLKSKDIGNGLNLEITELNSSIDRDEIKRIKRLIEMDADIWGGQFLVSRLLRIINNKENQIPAEVWVVIFTLGVRQMYELFYTHDEDEDVTDSDHPHSLIRAYFAITHGIQAVAKSEMNEYNNWLEIVVQTLLTYELGKFGSELNEKLISNYLKNEESYLEDIALELKSFQLRPKIKKTLSGKLLSLIGFIKGY